MEKAAFEKAVTEFIEKAGGNVIGAKIALRPDLAGMRIFDGPLFGYAAADDTLFGDYKKPGVIGPHFLAPAEWLPAAKTVVSLFLPFTAMVREANRKSMKEPADEWLHARIEGQAFQDEICRFIVSFFEKGGYRALAPMIDSRFSRKSPAAASKEEQDFYTSNWSERHAAYAAGLGTFGLSKGLITEKGVAGRYVSVITTTPFQPAGRPYSGAYDYCTNCGACVKNCPAGAISLEMGKNHFLCSEYVEAMSVKYAPRFGCGKCQVKVPCEFKRPTTTPAGR